MQPSEDERVLAALAHAGIGMNVVNLAGMVGSALIWVMQRERSRYVRAHALQALVYQGVVLLCTLLLLLLWGMCLGLSLLPALLRPDLYRDSSPPTLFWLVLAGLIIPICFIGAATLYALYGAYQTYHGRPFRYPLVGRLVQRELVAAQPAAAPAGAAEEGAVPPDPPAEAAPDADR